MKIEKIHPYKFKNDDHFQFYAEFITLIQSHGAVKQKVAALFDALALVEGRAIYDEFIGKLNIIIAKFALLYKPKGGKEKAEDTQTDGGSL